MDETEALERILRIAGAVMAGGLVAFGLIVIIAANWNGLGKVGRFALAGGMLAFAGAVSIAFDRIRVPGALVGVASIGGLLALIGQTYQTGADLWSLFAMWAGLALPWVIAARHDSVWVLWVAIVHTALPLWLVAQGSLLTPALGPLVIVFLLGGAIAVLLSPTLDLGQWIGTTRWAFRLGVVSLCVLVAATSLPSMFEAPALNAISATGILALLILVGLLAATEPFDMALLAIATLALDVLLIALVVAETIEGIGPGRTHEPLFFISAVSVTIVAASATAVIAIGRRRLAGLSIVATEAALWPVLIITTVGALIAAVPVLAFIYVLLGDALSKQGGAYSVGAILVAGAGWVCATTRPLGFVQQFAIIFVIAGLSLIAYALFRDASATVASFTLLLITVGLAVAVPQRWMAAVLGLLAAYFAIMTLSSIEGDHDRAQLSSILGGLIVAAVGAIAIVVCDTVKARPEDDKRAALLSRGDHFILGWATATLIALMVGSGSTFLVGANWTRLSNAVFQSVPLDLSWSVTRTLSVAMVVATAAWAFGASPRLQTTPALAATAVLVVLAYVMNSLGGAIALLAVALATRRRILSIFALLAVTWMVGSFYYWLGWPLMMKGVLLVLLGLGLGSALLLSARRLPPLPELAALPGLASGLSAALVCLSLVATSGIAASAVWQKENIIANGRTIYVALAPVDPRSLMQGDYMSLRFALPAVPSDVNSTVSQHKWAVAKLEPRGIATVTSLAAQMPSLGADEVAIRLAVKDGRPLLGTDAYYFPEGRGHDFAQARYGEFRLGADGELVLIGLADASLRDLK